MLAKQSNIKQKNKKADFLCTFLGTLGASLLGNLLASKGVIRPGDEVIWAGEGTIRVGQDF